MTSTRKRKRSFSAHNSGGATEATQNVAGAHIEDRQRMRQRPRSTFEVLLLLRRDFCGL